MSIFIESKITAVAEQTRVILEYNEDVEVIPIEQQIEDTDFGLSADATWIVECQLHYGAMSIFQYRVGNRSSAHSENPPANRRWRIVWKGIIVFDCDIARSSWDIYLSGGGWRRRLKRLYGDTICADY